MAGNGQDWFYHSPASKGKSERVNVPPASQIPGLSQLIPDDHANDRQQWVCILAFQIHLLFLLRYVDNMKHLSLRKYFFRNHEFLVLMCLSKWKSSFQNCILKELNSPLQLAMTILIKLV